MKSFEFARSFSKPEKLDRPASKVAGAVLHAFQKRIVHRKFCWFENQQSRPAMAGFQKFTAQLWEFSYARFELAGFEKISAN